jgi:hypothetical protein
MPGTRSKTQIRQQLKKAAACFDAGEYFAADRSAMHVVQTACKQKDYATVADALELVGRARHANRELAIAAGKLIEIDQWPDGASAAMADPDETASGARRRRGNPDDLDIGWAPEPAAYLFKPPLVGADGRALRDLAERLEIPIFVVVREPTTRMNLWPVVMIGPAVVRVRIPPPPDDQPTIQWMVHAQEQLGAEAARECETEERLEIRLELLLERIGTLHYDRDLFDAAIDTAKAHARALRREARSAAAHRGPGDSTPTTGAALGHDSLDDTSTDPAAAARAAKPASRKAASTKAGAAKPAARSASKPRKIAGDESEPSQD